MRFLIALTKLSCILLVMSVVASHAYQASTIPSSNLIQTDELVKIILAPGGERPLMLQVGSRVLFQQAHISGSEYVGAASTDAGLQAL
jgi:hypothetical protein